MEEVEPNPNSSNPRTMQEQEDPLLEEGDVRWEDQPKPDQMKFVEEKVKSVYHYRDHYFETHGFRDAWTKNERVEQMMQTTVFEIQDVEKDISVEERPRFYFLKGRLLNVVPKYSPEAEELLSKAIKLDHKLFEAWNELGECYWKKDDFSKAINCFERAVAEHRNKTSLRSLSMLSRQAECKSVNEKINNLKKGLQYAKEAVEMDPQDGISWSVLANAHLSSFFGIEQDPAALRKSLKAFTQAEKDPIARNTADLHFNKGMTLKYAEEFLPALESFKNAHKYDPFWEPAKTKEQQLVKYLNDINEFVSTCGKIKAKKLQQMLKAIEPKYLGLYRGVYQSVSGHPVQLTEVKFSELNPGPNGGTVVLGKVVCSVHNEETVPFTFCMVDKTGHCVAVTIYNLADGKGVIIGDAVAIPEPYVADVDFSYNDANYNFRMLRVETPLTMVVNGKRVGKDYLAGVRMSIFKKPE